jgi:glycosyltransferase involved in cell wall biosynthesis
MTVGVVVIGRNEGERLQRCLRSLVGRAAQVVYVDSASSDDSVEFAESLGVDVVRLDMGIPFTAARARNEGFRRLCLLGAVADHVQFVDGDCEVASGWLEKAAEFLDGHENVAAVCGRLREMYPERSVFNMLCDLEWEKPIGEVSACGGNAMMRVNAFEAMGGFRSDLIAGEEPELCVRLRAAGWTIWCLGEEMALHDAAITRFSQWWRRTLRGGYACALGASIHGASPERHRVRESRSTWFWGLVLPCVIAFLSAWLGPAALGLFLVYPLQVVRLALRGGRSPRTNWLRAGFLVLGKFPEMLGQLKFHAYRWFGKQSRLIEYK